MNTKSYFSWFLFVLLVLLPVTASLLYSLLYSFGLTGILSEGFTTGHWYSVWRDADFFKSVAYSILIALLSVASSVAIAFFLMIRSKEKLQQKMVAYLLFIPLGIPALVAAFFSFQMLGSSGFFSRLAYSIGLSSNQQDFPVLVNDAWAVSIIITHIFLAIPYFLMLFQQVFQAERLALLEQVAANLGANASYIRRTITLPVLLRNTLPSIIMFVIFVMGSYEIPLLLGSSGNRMLSPLIADKMLRFDVKDKPEAHVMLVLYVIFVFIVTIWLHRRVARSHA